LAAEGWRARDALIERLEKDSRRFDFVTAAILLRRLFATTRNPRAFRYVARTKLAFPAAQAELESLPDPETGAPGRLRVAFMGLTGLTSPLPAHYTELVEKRARAQDRTLRSFLSMFEDRFAAMLLHAHVRQRFWLSFAWRAGPRPGEETESRDPFMEMVLAMIGCGSGDLRDRVGIPIHAQVHYGGLLAQQPRSGAALAGMVGDIFQTATRIEPFRGKWTPMPAGAANRFGAGRLGRDFVMGERYFDPAAGFLVAMGPMRLDKALDLMPGRPGAERLQSFARFCAGPALDFDYQLVVADDEVPAATLVASGDAPQRLGWSLWMRAHDEPRPAVAGPFPASELDPRPR